MQDTVCSFSCGKNHISVNSRVEFVLECDRASSLFGSGVPRLNIAFAMDKISVVKHEQAIL